MSNGRYRGIRGSVVDLWYRRATQDDGSIIYVPSARHGRGKRFAARYVDAESREHQRSFELRREAEVWLREQLARVDQGRHVAPRAGRATVTQVYEAYVKDTDGHLAKATRSKRRTVWRRYVEPRWGRVPIGQITTASLRAWVTDLHDSGMSPGYVRMIVYMLSAILKTAVEQGIIARSPMVGVQLPRGVGRRRGYLTHEQVRLLAEEAEVVGGRRVDGLIITWMAYTGTRIDETSRILVGDVNRHTQRVQVYKTKNGRPRPVPIPVVMQEELAALCADRPPEAALFPTTRGNRIRQYWVETVFDVAVEKARERDVTFPKITPHQLRHTCASLAVASGASVLALSRLLGHATPTVTLTTYADLLDSDLDAVAEALEAARRAAVAKPWRDGAPYAAASDDETTL